MRRPVMRSVSATRASAARIARSSVWPTRMGMCATGMENVTLTMRRPLRANAPEGLQAKVASTTVQEAPRAEGRWRAVDMDSVPSMPPVLHHANVVLGTLELAAQPRARSTRMWPVVERGSAPSRMVRQFANASKASWGTAVNLNALAAPRPLIVQRRESVCLLAAREVKEDSQPNAFVIRAVEEGRARSRAHPQAKTGFAVARETALRLLTRR